MQIKLCLLPLITLEQKIYAISLNPDKLEMLNINLSKIKEVVNIRSLISELYGKYIELDVNWHFPVLLSDLHSDTWNGKCCIIDWTFGSLNLRPISRFASNIVFSTFKPI